MYKQREIVYSTGEAEKLTGASQKHICYWISRGTLPNQLRGTCAAILLSNLRQFAVHISYEIV
jgi:DNA-binding transcriptional MerR regulator